MGTSVYIITLFWWAPQFILLLSSDGHLSLYYYSLLMGISVYTTTLFWWAPQFILLFSGRHLSLYYYSFLVGTSVYTTTLFWWAPQFILLLSSDGHLSLYYYSLLMGTSVYTITLFWWAPQFILLLSSDGVGHRHPCRHSGTSYWNTSCVGHPSHWQTRSTLLKLMPEGRAKTLPTPLQHPPSQCTGETHLAQVQEFSYCL